LPEWALTYFANHSDRPSWPGGVAAAKPQTGWWGKVLKTHEFSDKRLGYEIEFASVNEPPPRRFAPPLLTRRGDRSELLADVKASKQSSKNPGLGRPIQRFQFLEVIPELKSVAEDDKVGAALIRRIEIQYNAGPSRVGGMDALADPGAFTRIEGTRTHSVRRHRFCQKGLVSMQKFAKLISYDNASKT